jgi:hypothetical protein
MDCSLCICWNELKEEIKAIAEIFKINDLKTVYPVGGASQISCRREPDGKQSDQSFAQVLQQVKEEEQKNKEIRTDDNLRMLGGLNQYNRYAVEFCYMLSSEADYRA